MSILTTKGAWGYVWPLDINTQLSEITWDTSRD